MANTEIIGIMLPFKNEERHLQACLDSIAQQDYPHFTVAMVDDHSTDTSAAIAKTKAQQDDRFQYFANTGTGVIAALRTAASKLNTPYITRMDGDDIMPPNKLAALRAAVRPNILVYGSVRYFGTVTEGYKNYEHWLNSTLHQKRWTQEIFRECVVPACSWLMHTNDFKSAVRWEDLQLPEDYHLLLQWFTAGIRIKGIPNLVHWWRHHSNRTSLHHEGYSIPAFTALKWRVLRDHFIPARSPLVLWGSGPKLKILQQCVAGWNGPFIAVSDINTAKKNLEKQLQRHSNAIVLSVVGSKTGLHASRRLFLKLGLKENQSFFFL